MNKQTVSGEQYSRDVAYFVDLRARWMIRLAQKLDAMGEDADGVLTAIAYADGVELAEKVGPVGGADELVDTLAPEGPASSLFDNEKPEMSPDRAVLIGHSCSGIEEWTELGLSDDGVVRMCDLLTNRDRGLAHTLGFDLDLDKAIARGDPICRLVFTRREQA